MLVAFACWLSEVLPLFSGIAADGAVALAALVSEASAVASGTMIVRLFFMGTFPPVVIARNEYTNTGRKKSSIQPHSIGIGERQLGNVFGLFRWRAAYFESNFAREMENDFWSFAKRAMAQEKRKWE